MLPQLIKILISLPNDSVGSATVTVRNIETTSKF